MDAPKAGEGVEVPKPDGVLDENGVVDVVPKPCCGPTGAVGAMLDDVPNEMADEAG